MRIAFVPDYIPGRDWNETTGRLAYGRVSLLFQYTAQFVGATEHRVFPAHPDGEKHTAAQYREHTADLKKKLQAYKPDLIVLLGRGASFHVGKDYPASFMGIKKFEKLWGKPFEWLGTTAVVTLSPSMLWVEKTQEGGYVYLRTLIENVARGGSGYTEPGATDYKLVDTRSGFVTYLRDFKPGVVGFDTETTGLNFLTDQLRTIQFSDRDNFGITVPWGLFSPAEWQATIDWMVKRGAIFAMQNGKFDYKFLRHNGVRIPDWLEVAAMHVIVDERPDSHNLEFISQQLLGEGKYEVNLSTLTDGSVADSVDYAARDADLTRRTALILRDRVGNTFAHQVLQRAIGALAEAEYTGILVNQAKLDSLHEASNHRIAELGDYLREKGIEPTQPKSVSKFFRLTGSSDKAALQGLVAKGEEDAGRVLDYRGLLKVRSTYLDRIKAAILADGRFHPDYRIAGPMTGRTSSGSGKVDKGFEWLPINIQNIPRPPTSGDDFVYQSEKLRSELRYLFIADPGYEMFGVDLSAAEFRIAANLAGDEKMIEDSNNEFDIHSFNAIHAYALDVEIDESNPTAFSREVKQRYNKQRTDTKRGTFATLYGGQPRKIAETLGVELSIATGIQKSLFARYPRLKEFFNEIHAMVKSGKIITPWGRERIFPYSTGLFGPKQQAEMLREGQNYVIQSVASDHALLGLGHFDYHYAPDLGAQIQLFVHDAVDGQAPEGRAKEAADKLVEVMQTVYPWKATMYAEGHTGPTWGHL